MSAFDRRWEIEQKLERVRGWLHAESCPGLVLRQRSSFAWITGGGRGHVGTARDAAAAALLVTPDRFVLLSNNIEATRLIEEELGGTGIEIAEYPWYLEDGEGTALRALVSDVAALAGDAEPRVATALRTMRATLLDPELARFEELGALTARIVEGVCRGLAPGETEDEIAAAVHAAAGTHGARLPVCLVAADERIARWRHPLPAGRAIRDRAMIAACVERSGLVCSTTRLVSFVPLSADLQRRHEAVCRIDAAAILGSRPGRALREIFAEIVDAYGREGFADEWRLHHQGGSTGYQPREMIATTGTGTRVQPDQPFAWNPSIAGTKSEDTIVATDEGFRWITEPGPDWPTRTVEVGGRTVRRPDILCR